MNLSANDLAKNRHVNQSPLKMKIAMLIKKLRVLFKKIIRAVRNFLKKIGIKLNSSKKNSKAILINASKLQSLEAAIVSIQQRIKDLKTKIENDLPKVEQAYKDLIALDNAINNAETDFEKVKLKLNGKRGFIESFIESFKDSQEELKELLEEEKRLLSEYNSIRTQQTAMGVHPKAYQ